MALDSNFFDSISIEVVKKKYYNANKVEAVFQSIREQAAALNEENAALKERVKLLDKQRDDISDVILTAREVCNRMIEEAQTKSAAIIAAAEEEKKEIVRNGIRRQDYSVKKVEECFSRLREIQLSCIDSLNTEWQEFLADLPDDDLPGSVSNPEETGEEPAAVTATAFPIPEDLTDKVSSIVDQILAMHNATEPEEEA